MKVFSTPYLVLFIILGSVTITTVLADNLNPFTAPYVLNDKNGNVTRLTIISNGFVGIGTNNPQATLQIRTGTDQNFYAGGSFSIPGSVSFGGINDNNTANIPFEWRGKAFTFNNNVGIKTAPGVYPLYPLDVQGDIRLSGKILSPNNLNITSPGNICIGTC